MLASSSAINGASGSRLHWWQIVGGILLPIVCFVADLLSVRIASLAPVALWSFAGLGMGVLILSSRPMENGALRDAVHGALVAAGVGAGLIGVVLAPFTVVGLMFGIGVFGLIPFLAAHAFRHRLKALGRHETGPRARGAVLAGAAALVALPGLAQWAETRWLDARVAEAVSPDPRVAAGGLRRLADYPLRLGRGEDAICRGLAGSPPDESEEPKPRVEDATVLRELERLYGPDPLRTCETRLSD
ncbi:MAG TPA: hypothetical protein VF744_04705 [Beijerinckiaceae bacterium]|jgi:hypothetical protein